MEQYKQKEAKRKVKKVPPNEKGQQTNQIETHKDRSNMAEKAKLAMTSRGRRPMTIRLPPEPEARTEGSKFKRT